MTENYVWFAVNNRDDVPEDSEILYNIEKISGLKVIDGKVLLSTWLIPVNPRWYGGTTYFRQLQCLRLLAEFYGEDLKFFGFTSFSSDMTKMEYHESDRHAGAKEIIVSLLTGGKKQPRTP